MSRLAIRTYNSAFNPIQTGFCVDGLKLGLGHMICIIIVRQRKKGTKDITNLDISSLHERDAFEQMKLDVVRTDETFQDGMQTSTKQMEKSCY